MNEKERSTTESLILPIRGMFFQKEGRKLRRRLIPGNELFLRPVIPSPTATTTLDDAVEVKIGKIILGYVPDTHKGIVRKLLEEKTLEGVHIYRVSTDRDGYWRVSMELTYTRSLSNKKIGRIDRILGGMQVPNRDYATLIAAATEDESVAEEEWIRVWNETCFEGWEL